MSAWRAISWWDTLRLQLYVALPVTLWGVVAPRRWGVMLVVWLDWGRRTRSFLAALRERYGCDTLRVWFPFSWHRTWLVLDPPGIDALLAGEANQADPWLKKRALSRFVPDGVIVSSGKAWRERRTFNEAVLALGQPHPQRERFARIAAAEVDLLLADGRDVLVWADFQRLAERIAHQVLLGAGCVAPQASGQLARLAGCANWLLRHGPAFRALHAWLGRELASRSGDAGDAGAAQCPVGDAARLARRSAADLGVSSQVGFWFFVLKDAIELHVARTLALLAVHPVEQQRARVLAADLPAPEAIESLYFLDACLLEQLRLWTPVPLLLRRATQGFVLRDAIEVPAQRQLLVHAAFHHRDARQFGARADRFMPDAVASGPPLLVFSRHRQSCAGETLVRFVLVAVLAALLARARFTLLRPTLQAADLPLQIDHFALRLQIERGVPAHGGG
ncbi:MAG TPA: cytochrome P450 [Burkholderiaceae bacterium]|nr:cytochrome P450 [Burkholderiaceae bacterium]